MKSYRSLAVLFAAVVTLGACDHSDPAAPAAKAAADSAKEALQKGGDAVTNAASAAKTETEEMVDKAKASGDVDKAKAALDKAGTGAKEALDVAGQKTKELAERAKETVHNATDSGSSK